MISVCPRCGTPRYGDLTLCQRCGLDFSSIPVPANCQRCGAPLYPGYTQCGNCGFDSRYAAAPQWQPQTPPAAPTQPQWGQTPAAPSPPPAPQQWQSQPPSYGQVPPAYGGTPQYGQAPTPAPKPGGGNLGFAVAVLGTALLAVAVVLAFVVVTRSPAASPAPSVPTVAKASASATATPTATPVATTVATTVPAIATPEPAPVGTWTKYTSPDGAWTVDFPGVMAPIKVTQSLGSGAYKGNATVFAVSNDANTGYAVMFVDFDAAMLKGIDPNSYLGLIAPSVAGGLNGTVVSTADVKVGSYPALDETVSTSSNLFDMRLWFVGSRMYVLLTSSSPGGQVYPLHFMDSFKFK